MSTAGGEAANLADGREIPMVLWTYRRRFRVGDARVVIRTGAGFSHLESRLDINGRTVATDRTDFEAEGGLRNHRLAADPPDGRRLEVEAGYNSWWNVGVRAEADGRVVYESHPGRRVELPTHAKRLMEDQYGPGGGMDRLKANKPAIIADISLGLLFFAVAKLADLPTAAIVAAVAGLGLVVAQRFVKVDLLGGMALFGIVMLLLSAGFALAFQDDWAVKMRSTVVGLIGAGLFLTDGLLGGRYLGKRLTNYLPMNGLDPRRLAIGMGVAGLLMAGLNYGVAALFSTDIWLFYSSFADVFISMAFVYGALAYARMPVTQRAA